MEHQIKLGNKSYIIYTLAELSKILATYVHNFSCEDFYDCPCWCEAQHELNDFTAILWNMSFRIKEFFQDCHESEYNEKDLLRDLLVVNDLLYYHHENLAHQLNHFFEYKKRSFKLSRALVENEINKLRSFLKME